VVRGLWLEEKKLRLRDDLPVPEPPEGEIRVRVLLASICNTDLELVKGYYPFAGVLGHEFVGVVDENQGPLSGKRVVGEINAVCGTCPTCRTGRAKHCPQRTVLGIVNRNGAFAEYLTLPVENLHPVPDSLPTEVAVFTEPLAAALEIREQILVGPKHHVLVLGDGKLGQLIARTLALTGCELIVAGRHRNKLSLLDEAGISTCLSDSVAQGHFDLVVECTGSPEGFELARRAVRPRGSIVLKSTYAGSLEVDAAALVVDEITLIGSRCGPFQPALRLLTDATVDVLPLIEARYPLAQGLEAFNHARRPGAMKVLVEMTQPTTPSC
jgi:threonine dehydrogenase-like Zn-dependent dehydrogenase